MKLDFMVILIFFFFFDDTKWLRYIMNNLCRLHSINKRTRWQNDSHVFVPFWFSPVVSWSCFLCQVPPPGRHLWVAVQTVTREFIDQLQVSFFNGNYITSKTHNYLHLHECCGAVHVQFSFTNTVVQAKNPLLFIWFKDALKLVPFLSMQPCGLIW